MLAGSVLGRMQAPGAAPQLRSRAALAVAASSGRPLAQQRWQQRQLATLTPSARPAMLQRQQQRRSSQQQVTAAASMAAPAATAAASTVAQAFWPALVQAWNTNPAAVMMGVGACVLGVALSVFLLASIPTMLALRRSAHAMEALLLTVQAEVPDTAATLRLSGMELADCIQEVGALSTDISEGVRASARAVASAEAGIRQGGSMARKAVTEYVIPQARDRVESALQERARLEYTQQVLQNTKSAAQRLRFALAASGLARGVLQSARYLRQPGSGRRGGRESSNGSGDNGEELMGA